MKMLDSKTTFLVIGANGMLGWAVSSYFKSRGFAVVELTKKEFDIAKDPIKDLEKFINKSEVVVNCAGVIKPQIEKNKVEDVLKINGVFPWNLAKTCLNLKKLCFHITTDCVFSGKKGNYNENDLVDANDLYGISKNMGDTDLCMTFRVSIIGEELNNKRSLVEWIKVNKDKEINGFVNHRWNGITTVYLAQIIETTLLKGAYKPGIYHVFSSKPVSKFKLLKMVSKIYGLDCKIMKTKAPEKVDRSLASVKPFCSKVVNKSLNRQVLEMRDFFAKVK